MPDNLDSNFLNKLNSKYTNVKVHDVVENGDGSISMVLSGNKDNLSLTLNNVGRPIDTLEDVDISKLRRDRKRGQKKKAEIEKAY